MNGAFSADDLAAVRQEGSLADLFAQLAGKPIAKPEPPAEDEKPCFHIRRPGAWPCGTAATGPTPAPCAKCQAAPHRLNGDHP